MEIILKPVITEKATNDSELRNRYTFEVTKGVNKIQITADVVDNGADPVLLFKKTDAKTQNKKTNGI